MLAEPVALAPEAGREQVVGEVSAAAEAFGVTRWDAGGGGARALPRAAARAARPGGRSRALARGARPARGDRRRGRVGPRRAARSSRPTGCTGSMAGTSRACSRRRAGRSAAASAWARGPAASLLTPLRGGRGRGGLRWSRRAASAHGSRRCLSRFCARGRSSRSWRRRSSGSASAPSASCPSCRRRPSPSASATRACSRSTSRAAATRRSSHGVPPSRWSSGSSFPRRRSASSSSARSSCSSHACSRVPERRGRSLRSVALSARFVAGGTWRTRVTLRQASADAARLQTVLAPKLAELPAPADSIALEVEAFGPPAHDQGRLLEERDSTRRARLNEAVRQARQSAGEDAAMRDTRGRPRLAPAGAARAARSLDRCLAAPPPASGAPRPARVRAGARGRSRRGRRAGGRVRPRGMGGRGPLVDRAARCAGATSSACSRTAATPSSSATSCAAAGSSSAHRLRAVAVTEALGDRARSSSPPARSSTANAAAAGRSSSSTASA